MPEADDCRTGVSKNIDGGMGWNTCIIKELKRSMRSQRCRVKRAFLFCKNMCMHICVYIYIQHIGMDISTCLSIYLSIFLSIYLASQLSIYACVRNIDKQKVAKREPSMEIHQQINIHKFRCICIYICSSVCIYSISQNRWVD